MGAKFADNSHGAHIFSVSSVPKFYRYPDVTITMIPFISNMEVTALKERKYQGRIRREL